MTGLAGMWQVALREFRERGRSKTYLITSAVVLLIVIGLVTIPQAFGDETDEYELGLVGEGNSEIVAAAETLANVNDEPGAPASVEINTTEYDDRATAEQALSEGAVEAVLVDGEEVVLERPVGFTGSPILGLLQRGAATVELEGIVAEQGQAAADVVEVMTSDPLETTSLSGEDAQDESAGIAAYAGLMLLYGAILLYGTWILTGVTEEKTNRVMEVLLSSIRPWQLLGGKIVGIGTLGVAQFAGTVAVALIAINATDAIDLPSFTGQTLFHLVFWFLVGFLIYAFMFGAAGSLVSRPEDAQNIAFPMTLAAVASFFLSIVSLDDPEGVAATVGTFIPLTAPFVVPVRAALDAIPLWQYALSALLAFAGAFALMFIGGRIYSGAVLRYGGRVRYRDAWRGGA